MSTQSFAAAHSLPTLSRRTAELIATAILVIAIALVVVALNSGTTAPLNLAHATRITPAGVNTAQSAGTLNYPHSFAPSGSVSGGVAVAVNNTPFAGHR
jgi:hypothetical protein